MHFLLLIAVSAAAAAAAATPCGSFIVASLPYTAIGTDRSLFQVLAFNESAGTLAVMSQFKLHDVMEIGAITFSADGRIGVVPLKNGTVGVFALDCATGQATVLEASLVLDDYVTVAVVDTLDGDRFWLLGNYGILSIRVVNNSVVPEGVYMTANVPATLTFVEGVEPATRQLAVLITNGGVATLFDWPHKTILANVSGFPYSEPIVVSTCIAAIAATAADERFIVMVDDNQFDTGHPPAVGILRLTGLATGATPQLTPTQILKPFNDPSAVACSPFLDGDVLLSLATGNALLQINYRADNATNPFHVGGPVKYVGGAPQLPASLAPAASPALAGLVFVAELSGVRRVKFEKGGQGVTDFGLFSFGPKLTESCGGIGVNF